VTTSDPATESTVTTDRAGAGTPLLSVKDLVTRFATPRGVVRAVRGVSLDVARGESVAVIGESGSGKTVLVRSIMGILPRSAQVTGTISFNGVDLSTMTKTQRKHFWGPEIAMVFQDPMTSLNPVKKVGRQIIDPIRYHMGLSMKDARQRALELLEMVEVPDARRRIDMYPHEMSGGMRQRAVIAIALSCKPKLLIADEPTTALDVTVQMQILDLLSSLRSQFGMSLILITHDLGVAASRADRVAVMYAGRFVETADTNDLFASKQHPYTEALFRSIPLLSQPSHTTLEVIPGRPPDLVAPPPGCGFAPRCRYAQDVCREQVPALELAPTGHRHTFACFAPAASRAESAENGIANKEDTVVTFKR
jgi:peptide/nickel transport system ATP-binding protein